ncbi:MAG TPA: phosphopantetheine-binding protein [Polyangia bacterium]|nr:phosphopantetheine-binding protein [Polyangia bacterium]
MNDIEEDLKRVIVETLALEDMVPGDIDSEAALFGTGLGLDSIDALELSIAIGRRYGVRIKADDERNREIFSSVRNLAAFIAAEGLAASAAGKVQVQKKVGA